MLDVDIPGCLGRPGPQVAPGYVLASFGLVDSFALQATHGDPAITDTPVSRQAAMCDTLALGPSTRKACMSSASLGRAQD